MYAEMPDEESDEETHDDIIDYDDTLEDSKSPEIDHAIMPPPMQAPQQQQQARFLLILFEQKKNSV